MVKLRTEVFELLLPKPAKIKGQFPYSKAKIRGVVLLTEVQKTK